VIESALTPDRILDAAEEVLRRYGPAKTTVVDVARALDVSHGTIYRHFESKAALRDAVAERWLHRVSAPLAKIVGGTGPAPKRLRRWFEQLMAIKRAKVLDDPELFATYHALVADSRSVIRGHVDELVGQLTEIVEQGVAEERFAVAEPRAAAKALFDATARFHHPVHAAEWAGPDIDRDFDNLWTVLMQGLTSPARSG